MKDLEILYRFRLGDKSSLQNSGREEHLKLKVLERQFFDYNCTATYTSPVRCVGIVMPQVMCERLRLRCVAHFVEFIIHCLEAHEDTRVSFCGSDTAASILR